MSGKIEHGLKIDQTKPVVATVSPTPYAPFMEYSRTKSSKCRQIYIHRTYGNQVEELVPADFSVKYPTMMLSFSPNERGTATVP